jgi:hypothetical protein
VLRFDADEGECRPELRRQPATGGSAVIFQPWVFAGFQAGFWSVFIPTLGFTSEATPAPVWMS